MKIVPIFLLACSALCAQNTILVSCTGSPQPCNGVSFSSGSVVDFGYVSDGTTASVSFTVTNDSQSAASISLQTSLNPQSPFSGDASAPIPASIAAGATATFTVDFSPTQAALAQATLNVGSNPYALQGTGVDNTAGGASPLKFQDCSANCSTSTPLFSPWTFPDTAEGSENYLILRPVNPTNSSVKLITFTLTDTQDFSLTNEYVDELIAAQQTGTPFYVHFTPQTTGPLSTILTAIYCLPNASGACTGTASLTEPVVQLEGNGTAPQVVLSCGGTPQCNGTPLRPDSILDFGNVSVGSTASTTFTVTNGSQSPVSISLQTPVNLSTPFSSNPSGALPATVAAGATLTFTINFSPGQAVLSQATLIVGSSSFPLQGTGGASVLGDLSSLVVSYTDATGVRQIAQGDKIDFGQVVAGAPATLTIGVCNPQETINAVTIPVPTISGSGFTASGLPSAPVTIQPAATPPYCEPGAGTTNFQIAFAASAPGSYTGTLSIGTLQFALTAQSVTLPLPAMSFQVSEQPLTSQQQVNLTVQLASPSPIQAIGTLTMTFAPSVQSVSDDPAIQFLATNGRQLNVSVAAGSQTATYNSQSALTFQTGTTAGTITFTLQFPDMAPLTQSFTIAPQTVQIASATASISSPNLVITINGYDNTYSAGQLSFTFYDTKGNTITPGAMAVNATSQFQQYFFTNNKAGGAFAMQATFPVYGGDATQVGSVSVTMNNSAGATTITQTFQ